MSSFETYTHPKTIVQIENGKIYWFQIDEEVRQNYIFAPYLFNLYVGKLNWKLSMFLKTGERNIIDLNYANGPALKAENARDLPLLVLKIKEQK